MVLPMSCGSVVLQICTMGGKVSALLILVLTYSPDPDCKIKFCTDIRDDHSVNHIDVTANVVVASFHC